jgi:hypothetical protein
VTVIIAEARAVAAAWVTRHQAPASGFRGAFLTGSAGALPGDAALPTTSDVDVTVVVADHRNPGNAGKRLVDGVLLDVSYLGESALADPSRVAASFVYAPSFRGGQILADPTGHLARLEELIAPRFDSPAATQARVEDVRRRMRHRFAALDPTAPWADLVLAWLFPTSLTAVLALVAALRTPTVRLRYLRAREVLPDAEYEQLLVALGCAECGTPMVVRHLDALAERFDETSTAVARTGLDLTLFPFAADITPAARPVAIDGSCALVDAGDHREAVFWIVATAARCQSALSALAPESARVREPGFRELVADLTGLRTAADVLVRRDALLASLPSTDQTGAES